MQDVTSLIVIAGNLLQCHVTLLHWRTPPQLHKRWSLQTADSQTHVIIQRVSDKGQCVCERVDGFKTMMHNPNNLCRSTLSVSRMLWSMLCTWHKTLRKHVPTAENVISSSSRCASAAHSGCNSNKTATVPFQLATSKILLRKSWSTVTFFYLSLWYMALCMPIKTDFTRRLRLSMLLIVPHQDFVNKMRKYASGTSECNRRRTWSWASARCWSYLQWKCSSTLYSSHRPPSDQIQTKVVQAVWSAIKIKREEAGS